MRSVKDLPQIQIVINQLLDHMNRDQTRARDQRGHQIKNAGKGTDPNDLVTLAQISDLAPASSIPSTAVVNHYYTIPWSNDLTPIVGQVIPPFCIVNDDRVGQPTALWIAAGNAGTGPLSVNIKINGNNGQTPVTIFTADLTLPAGLNGPVKQSNFISPLPYFGIGTYIQPVLTAVNNQSAITIGLTVKKIRMAGLN